MTFAVRIFGYRGLCRLPVTQDNRTRGVDSVYVLEQPKLWSQLLTSNGSVAVTSVTASSSGHRLDETSILRIEVPDGSAIRYEVSNGQTIPLATNNSSLLTGSDNIGFGPGWLFSFIDVSSAPPPPVLLPDLRFNLASNSMYLGGPS